MGQVLHGSAATTEAVRRATQHSRESLGAPAKRHGIDQKIVAKWKKRATLIRSSRSSPSSRTSGAKPPSAPPKQPGAGSAPSSTAPRPPNELFVESLVFTSYDRAAADKYGEMVAAVGFSRRDIVDWMIAAHAISLAATLVTDNVRTSRAFPAC